MARSRAPRFPAASPRGAGLAPRFGPLRALALCAGLSGPAPGGALGADVRLLSSYADAQPPWLFMEANSEQRQPLYLGASPKAMAFGEPLPAKLALPEPLRVLAEAQAKSILVRLGVASAQLEAWPARDDEGRRTWVFARWRPDAHAPWRWLEAGRAGEEGEGVSPFLPLVLDPAKPEEKKKIFSDFLELGLYDKPVFGDCVWTGASGEGVVGAWLRLEERAEREASGWGEGKLCRVLPQPARFNARAVGFVLEAGPRSVRWPKSLSWRGEPEADFTPREGPSRVVAWGDFRRAYEEDVRTLSGEVDAVFPLSGRRARFTRKNSAQADHQLGEVIAYLEERYKALGLKIRRQEFSWRGIPQANLIAVIPGRLKGKSARPVVLADHLDAAFSEDEYRRNGARISAPGADDNASGTAALLRAAELLRDPRPKREIWLLHLTGEEFPADDLGARRFVRESLHERRDFEGVLLLDMIGWRKEGDPVFQLNAGEGARAGELARVALGAAKALGVPGASARARFDARSYLYNTDGLIFSDAGYPVLLFNEHLNSLENMDRPHYHETTDTAERMDFEYAASVARVAVETAARLAER